MQCPVTMDGDLVMASSSSPLISQMIKPWPTEGWEHGHQLPRWPGIIEMDSARLRAPAQTLS